MKILLTFIIVPVNIVICCLKMQPTGCIPLPSNCNPPTRPSSLTKCNGVNNQNPCFYSTLCPELTCRGADYYIDNLGEFMASVTCDEGTKMWNMKDGRGMMSTAATIVVACAPDN
ncbi:hypothetical protein PMAYCL1PPCAC_28453 [Pristionchus mayeri]|uniref:Uncharacterized protein n=1 Tax=Pristionchus mayeri TaxID=1317129 RepID=A0AAN5IA09_9BILA|nr:hypothetical protein PMAYCL1PPCAC_28453 [Pristionchus mayeri]